jgi:hypothetical protein
MLNAGEGLAASEIAGSGSAESTGAGSAEIAVESPVSVFFGGLEFRLSGEREGGLANIDFDGIRRPLTPLSMSIDGTAVRFMLSGGSTLAFYVQNTGASDELIVSASLAEDVLSVEVPYRLTKNSGVVSRQNSRILIAHNKIEYTFDKTTVDTDRQIITFDHKNPVIAYRRAMAESKFNPSDYIISGTMSKPSYTDILRQWCSRALGEWQAEMRGTENNEALVAAFVAESARQENYNPAISALPEAFLRGSDRTFLTSTFIGRLESAAYSLIRFEDDRYGGIERIVNDGSPSFLMEYKAFEYMLQRSKTDLFEAAIQIVRNIKPDTVTLELCPGIFESWWSYNQWYKGRDNPFEMLATQARLLVSESLVKDGENLRVFVLENGRADLLYAIRLGISLSEFGDASGNSEWAAIGRSLVLSALSFADDAAVLPSAVTGGPGLNFTAAEDASGIEGARIYPYLDISPFYPHAIGADTVMYGVWLWTSSPAVAAAYKNNILEFGITFPLSSPHYLMILGIRPFSRIQMRGMDYRSDPQFERYNSPGWMYLPKEQILLIKMVHRTELETVKIFF